MQLGSPAHLPSHRLVGAAYPPTLTPIGRCSPPTLAYLPSHHWQVQLGYSAALALTYPLMLFPVVRRRPTPSALPTPCTAPSVRCGLRAPCVAHRIPHPSPCRTCRAGPHPRGVPRAAELARPPAGQVAQERTPRGRRARLGARRVGELFIGRTRRMPTPCTFHEVALLSPCTVCGTGELRHARPLRRPRRRLLLGAPRDHIPGGDAHLARSPATRGGHHLAGGAARQLGGRLPRRRHLRRHIRHRRLDLAPGVAAPGTEIGETERSAESKTQESSLRTYSTLMV